MNDFLPLSFYEQKVKKIMSKRLMYKQTIIRQLALRASMRSQDWGSATSITPLVNDGIWGHLRGSFSFQRPSI